MDEVVTLKISPDLAKRREEFRAAVDSEQEFRDEAHEDVDFYASKQWCESTKKDLEEQGRPAITDNRLKPLINIVSGYQRLNRYEPEFKPRTSSDEDLCAVRKGLTKFVFDQCDYGTQESLQFLDGVICGRAWLNVYYDIDYTTLEGEARIKRISPFDIYVDPESREADYSDARYMCHAKWADKDELKVIYPEHASEIDACVDDYDEAERQDFVGLEPLWYQKDTKKVRLIEHWRKEIVQQQFYLLNDGTFIPAKKITTEHIAAGIKRPVTLPTTKVIVCIFIGEVLLEEKDSPYEHGEFPFVPYTVYYLGEGDIPAGIIRDLKDLQRELNKRRSQSVAILNTQLNGGIIYEQGAIDAHQKENIKRLGTTPGVMAEVTTGGLSRIKILTPAAPPVGDIQSIQETAQSIKEGSGINESMLGSDIPAGASGYAIELRQKAAITHIGGLFDNQRRTKLQVVKRLWGHGNKRGIIQQYYTEEKTFRIVGDNGKPDYLTINKQVPVKDETGQIIWKTLNDVSVGEFDIVISESPAAATQRTAQFMALVDAVSKLGIPGDMVFDILIDLCDLPQKEEIKRRWQERQQQMAQAGGPQPKINETINIKDVSPEAAAQMLARIGIQTQPQGGLIPGMAGGQFMPGQMTGQSQQASMLQQVIENIPPQYLQQLIQLAQSNPQQFIQAITQIEQNLPPQIRQQIAIETRGMAPQQVLQIILSLIVQALQRQVGGQGPGQLPQNQQSVPNHNQPQTMTQPALRQVANAMNPGI